MTNITKASHKLKQYLWLLQQKNKVALTFGVKRLKAATIIYCHNFQIL